MVEVLNDGKRPARIIDIIVRRLREFFIRKYVSEYLFRIHGVPKFAR